ncbi:hypothetical protein OSTOST_09329, partial [Ostertagia ostertagi]
IPSCVLCKDCSAIQSSPAFLLSLPVLGLSLLTLTTTMNPEQRFMTSASFAILALSRYLLAQTSWTMLIMGYILVSVANLTYYYSFKSQIRLWSTEISVAAGIFLFIMFWTCFADLLMSIPSLVLLLTAVLGTACVTVVAAGSVCQHGLVSDDDSYQDGWRLGLDSMFEQESSVYRNTVLSSSVHEAVGIMNDGIINDVGSARLHGSATGGTTFLVYVETDGFRQHTSSMMFGLPLITLSFLSLTSSMQPRARFATAASFAILAMSRYLLVQKILMGSHGYWLYTGYVRQLHVSLLVLVSSWYKWLSKLLGKLDLDLPEGSTLRQFSPDSNVDFAPSPSILPCSSSMECSIRMTPNFI